MALLGMALLALVGARRSGVGETDDINDIQTHRPH
jgi:hypothetical protein